MGVDEVTSCGKNLNHRMGRPLLTDGLLAICYGMTSGTVEWARLPGVRLCSLSGDGTERVVWYNTYLVPKSSIWGRPEPKDGVTWTEGDKAIAD